MFNGQKIKILFEERGIQQTTFTLETGISKSNLYVWMEGKSKPGADGLETLANFFKVPIDFFFDRDINQSGINLGHQVNGNCNKVSGGIALNECQKEITHLRQLLKEKEAIINEKERTIQILINK